MPDIYWEQQGNSLTLILPDQPVTVIGGDEAFVHRRKYKVQFPNGGQELYLTSIWTFIGTDRGDVVEADIELVAKNGTKFYHRSYHKHDAYSSFESWHHHRPLGLATGSVDVVFVGRVLSENRETAELEARIHYGVVLEGEEE